MDVESSVPPSAPVWGTMLRTRTTRGVVGGSGRSDMWGSSSETKNYGGTQEVENR